MTNPADRGQTTRSIQNDLRRYSTNWSRWTYTSNRFADYAGTETACPFLAHMTPAGACQILRSAIGAFATSSIISMG